MNAIRTLPSADVVDLIDARQREVAGTKHDLPAELAALALVPGVRDVVDALTDPSPDTELLEDLICPFDGSLTRDGSLTQVVLRAPASQPWPAELGGDGTSDERVRVLTISVRHAGWRDRRVRRLTGVKVQSLRTPAPAADTGTFRAA
jgi:hypothetical protein